MRTALTIGNFDGVHRGHQALLTKSRDLAGPEGEVHALFFDPHPAEFFGRSSGALLTHAGRRRELLQAFGADRVNVRAFDADFAAQSPEAFVQNVVVGDHAPAGVVVGPDFRFGKAAAGDVAMLKKLGADNSFEVAIVDAVKLDGEVVSSTRIRKALAAGDVAHASRLLARPYDLAGRVIQGDQRGRTIGFPTANIDAGGALIPRDGVYAVVGLVQGARDQRLRGMANLGTRPTFAAGRSLEVHFFDFDGDIYDENVRIAFVDRLRDESKFDGVDALVTQLKQDEAHARELLSTSDGEWWQWM